MPGETPERPMAQEYQWALPVQGFARVTPILAETRYADEDEWHSVAPRYLVKDLRLELLRVVAERDEARVRERELLEAFGRLLALYEDEQDPGEGRTIESWRPDWVRAVLSHPDAPAALRERELLALTGKMVEELRDALERAAPIYPHGPLPGWADRIRALLFHPNAQKAVGEMEELRGEVAYWKRHADERLSLYDTDVAKLRADNEAVRAEKEGLIGAMNHNCEIGEHYRLEAEGLRSMVAYREKEVARWMADNEALRKEKAELMEQVTLDVRALNGRAQEAEALRADCASLQREVEELRATVDRQLGAISEGKALRARVKALEGMREVAEEKLAWWAAKQKAADPEGGNRYADGGWSAIRELLGRWPAASSAPDDHSALQARVAELEGKLKKEETASERLIRERDHFQERVDRLADELGVEEEWTNVTDRGQEAEYAANALVSRLSKLDALLASEEVPDGLWKAVGSRQHGTEGWHSAVLAWRWFREALGAPPVPSMVTRKIDPKFGIAGGQIVKTSSGEIVPEDEPLMLLRARDRLALPLLWHYRELSRQDGCNDFHLAGVDDRIADFEAYAKAHPTKQPGVTRGAAWTPPAAPPAEPQEERPGPLCRCGHTWTQHHGGLCGNENCWCEGFLARPGEAEPQEAAKEGRKP